MTVFERIDRRVSLSPEENLLVDTVGRLADGKLEERAAGHDAAGTFPWDNVRDINELGLNAMFIPEAFGGAPVSYTAYLHCVRAMAKACASTAIIWATNFHAVRPIITFGTDEQRSRLLPRIAKGGLAALCITEPGAGSDAAGMTTRLAPDGDAIVIDGGKSFITNAGVAELYLVFAKWSEIGDHKSAISALVVERETPGLTVLADLDKMGLRASRTAGLAFDGCRVPRQNLLGEPGDGLRILLSSLNTSRPSVAAHALGIARAAFEDALAYVNTRRQSGRRIVEFQGIQFLLADLAAELALTESWLWHVGALVDGGAEDFAVEASILKMRASDLAMRMATEAVQLHGGYGYCRDFRVERLMRDAKITQIWEGTNQIHRQFIGRSFIER